MEKKYTVFVSSTYEDLKEERSEVMRALLECDCIPCGMELFPAANEDSWSFIKRVIDECDYYLLIVAGRYGSTGAEGISYTEMEFRYATEKGKPVISFPHANPGGIPVDKSCKTDAERRGLEAFMKLVNQKLRKTWSTSKELGALVYQSITQLKKDYPAVGWVKGNTPASEELLIENRNLQKENDELRKRIADIEAEKSLDLAHGNDPVDIEFTVKYYSGDQGEREKRLLVWHTTWDEIFFCCFPAYQTSVSNDFISFYIQEAVNDQCAGEVDASLTEMVSLRGCVDNWSAEESKKRFGTVDLRREIVNKILFHFTSLGYIKKEVIKEEQHSNRAHVVVRNKNVIYWTLTDKGLKKVTQLYAVCRVHKDGLAQLEE